MVELIAPSVEDSSFYEVEIKKFNKLQKASTQAPQKLFEKIQQGKTVNAQGSNHPHKI